MSEQGTGCACLERLSPELLIQILLELSTSEALYSIIRGSPKCYQVFLRSKARILTGLVRQSLHPDAVADALTAVRAMQLKNSRPNRKEILNFIQRYERSRDKRLDLAKLKLSVPTAVRLVLLHWSTLWFNGYDDADAPASTSETILGVLVAPARPLFGADKGRIQRAFYRYEVYVHLFNSDIQSHGRRLFKDACSSHFFLQKYSLREVGDLECVDGLLRTFVSRALDKFERASPGKQPIVFSLDGNGAASLGLPWPIMRNNTMEYLLSTGVANIHRFVMATEKEQRRIISSEAGNDTIISRHSLEAALEDYPPRPLRD